jgi:hypothetical protein
MLEKPSLHGLRQQYAFELLYSTRWWVKEVSAKRMGIVDHSDATEAQK